MSLRLDAIVSMAPDVNTAADIGCDHGKAAVMLLSAGKARRAICSDISGKSLEKARRLARSKGLEERMSFREGDGLDVLEESEADAAVIAGMGGELITKILEQGKEKAPHTLVLSCNTKPEILRAWLCANGYVIEDEDLVAEGRRFYPVILAKRGDSHKLKDTELEFGPVLLKKRPETLLRLLDKRIGKAKEHAAGIKMRGSKDAEQKWQEIEETIRKYEELRHVCSDE